MATHATARRPDPTLSLYHLLDPEVLADPYPLYHRLRREAPVHWDPYLHAWVVTRYTDVLNVFQHFSAARTPTPEQLRDMDMGELGPISRVMVRQMLFMDPPDHTRVRTLAARAFTPRRVEVLRGHIQDITNRLLDDIERRGRAGGRRRMDVIADLGAPLPAIVTTEMLGVPSDDWEKLKAWSTDFAEMLGNFQHNPGRITRVLQSVEEMTAYFREAVRQQAETPTEGLVNALAHAEVDGDRFSEDEVVANLIVTMVGGLETTTNLIGNGLLSLLRNPLELERLRSDPALIPSAVEELLRYESPSQHTARLAPDDVEIGGRLIRKRQAVIAVMGAANRDPSRFPEPDRLDLGRQDNRHVAFGWAGHFCFGAPLARIEGQIAFGALLRRLPDLRLEPEPLVWRENLGLRGLKALPVSF
ncbi:MAG: cytochrome P450 [Candidatus Nephthysia bennettiae]|uniref:Cytochrome P450 n=1 Tax=Candidatus Nephthysia bennettiae TaxID=3127016 RepID=A0A934N7J4_9BACT|nr:cytochrome P450 [Candidatus Dormibacteraeota bacterium]MBJ7612686.1 cytochrome P450 [Candidatus Dormibacteraeota bacterium]PZR91141.1 MAG: cytochrome P450 [Candidatus Dormibacteraeota bacterium]